MTAAMLVLEPIFEACNAHAFEQSLGGSQTTTCCTATRLRFAAEWGRRSRHIIGVARPIKPDVPQRIARVLSRRLQLVH
jgi:hypothetical protein